MSDEKEQMQTYLRNLETKKTILRNLGTKDLIDKLPEYENALEKALFEEASFRNLSTGFLAAATSDCAEVKRILAELSARVPEMLNGKKTTAADRDAWLIQQRTDNQELATAIKQQVNVSFLLENNRTAIEMAKKRLESIKAVLALRTAQINFLAE